MKHFPPEQVHTVVGPDGAAGAVPAAVPRARLGFLRASRQMRVLAACGVILVGVIIAATATLAVNMRARAVEDTRRELQNTALILSEHTNQSFRSLELVQTSLIEHMRAKQIETHEQFVSLMSGQGVHHMLVDKISGLPQIDAVTIIDETGKLINFSRYWPIPPVNVSDRDYFKALLADRQRTVFLSEPVQNRGTGTWTIYLARKFTGSDGRFLGLVLGAIRLRYFEEYFGSIALGKDGAVALLRSDGMLLARHPNRDQMVGRIYPAIPGESTRPVVMRRVSLMDGKERLIAIRPIHGLSAIIAVSTTVAASTAAAEHDAFLLSGAGGALALCVGVLVFLLARRTATEQRRAQGALEQQQEKLDAALNNMSQGLVMFDPDERFVLCNDQYLRMYKLPRDAVTPGCDRLTLIRARKAAGMFAGDPEQYCAEMGAPSAHGNREYTTDTPDGRTILILRRSMSGGGWVTTHEDITERRRAEQERDRSRDLLDLVIENVPVMIIVKDARDLRYVMLNRASERRLGFAEGEAVGKCAHDIFPQATADVIESADRRVLREGGIHVIPEHELEIPGLGRRIQRSTRVPILGEDGQPLYVMIVAEDLTERKAVEHQLRQAVKMEAVGNLTGGIAHDFNNLLMIMIGNLDLLAEEVADNASAREKVETVLQAGLHGAELTRQMLAFSRRQPLKPERVKVDDLIGATAKLLARSLGTDIATDVRTVDDLWPVRVDESQLQSSIVNIAVNARDAMPGGGKLIIEASNVVVETDSPGRGENMNPGDYVMVSISDTGAGMPAELVARAFEPFFTTKAQGKGSGLGLSMVYGFAKQSGGHVSIYSEVGRGTTLKLYLPRDVEHVPQDASLPPAEPVPLGGGEIILAVDDNKDVLTTVARQLTDLGYDVATAGSAFSALRSLEGGLPAALLFTDVVMPGGMSGKDLADEALRRYPNLKVLLTSGFTDAFLTSDASLHNTYNLLNKPYRKPDLARAVRQALDRGKLTNG